MNLQSSLSNLSFLTLFLSMIFYWIQTFQFGKNKNSIIDFQNFNLGVFLMFISNFSIFIILVLRWKESGHFPLSNLYESLMFLSWSLIFLHLCIELNMGSLDSKIFNFIFKTKSDSIVVKDENMKSQLTQKKRFFTKFIGSVTAPCALFTNAFASFSLPSEMQASSPLVPALQSNWLMMHVTVMILSYAALIIGSLLSIGFLILTGGKEVSNLSSQNSFFPINFAMQNELFSVKKPTLNTTNLNSSVLVKDPMILPIILDNLSYRILGIGFPLLTIGILSGAVWANEAWGSYWSWDPKETWALLTWLVFAIYLHTRLTKGWEGRKPALIASLGFISVWMCYLGVNLIGEGLHSYGWM